MVSLIPRQNTEYVGDLVFGPAETLPSSATLAEIIGKLGDLGIGLVVILNGDEVAGVVSERDVVWALSKGADPEDVWAADMMSVPPVMVDPSTLVADAVKLMVERNMRHLVVDGDVPGVISLRDAVERIVH